MPELQPRELPLSSGFSTPHVQAYHGAQFFYQLLENQTSAVFDRAAELGGGEEALMHAAAADALQRQALSEAVQVFAAMTVEGAVNLLGVMVLGEQQFLSRLERKPQPEKLKTLLELIGAESTDHGLRILGAAKRLADARNEFVHPKPQEGQPRFNDHGRRSDVDGARQAMADVFDFFSALRQCDPRYAVFFVLF